MKNGNRNLVGRFFRIDSLLRRYHHNRRHGFLGESHRGQGRVLAILSMRPDISQKELCYLLDMRSQSLGELLSKLERQGHITRTQDDSDRRAMNIKLTAEGAEAAKHAEEEQKESHRLFDMFEEAELATLTTYLDKFITALEAKLENSELSEEEFTQCWHRHRHAPEFDHKWNNRRNCSCDND